MDVAILSNSDAPPTDLDFLATILAAEVIGRPYQDPTRIRLPDAVLESYVGVYRIDENSTRTITREGGRLFMQRTGAPKYEIHASAEGELSAPHSFQRLSFVKDKSGSNVEFGLRRGTNVTSHTELLLLSGNIEAGGCEALACDALAVANDLQRPRSRADAASGSASVKGASGPQPNGFIDFSCAAALGDRDGEVGSGKDGQAPIERASEGPSGTTCTVWQGRLLQME